LNWFASILQVYDHQIPDLKFPATRNTAQNVRHSTKGFPANFSGVITFLRQRYMTGLDCQGDFLQAIWAIATAVVDFV
jgi:hypothetical protein